jgi:F-type H+-transporting ATPase subunit b
MLPLAVESVNWIGELLDFRSNFINWALLVGLLWWMCSKYLPPVFEARKKAIDEQIQEAAQAKKLAAQLVVDNQSKVAQADKDVEAIVVEARQTAEQLRIKLEEQTKRDLEELRKKFETACTNERQLAISQMRAIVVRTAIEIARQSLAQNLSEQSKAQLLTQFIEQLKKNNNQEDYAPSQEFEKIH